MPHQVTGREPTEELAHEGEHTQIDSTEIGTQAESPKALSDAAAQGSLHATEHAPARPSGWATTSNNRTPHPTAAQAFDKSDLARSNMFHIFGICAPLGALVMSLLIGGDETARYAFWIGAGMISLGNVGLVYFTSKPERYNATVVGLLWIFATIGVQPAVYYFGPFSAVVMVDMLGIVFIAIGRVRWMARATAIVCIGGHLVIATPIIAGWIPDVGIMASIAATNEQMIVAEVLIVVFLTSGYFIGRWARSTASSAFRELQSAMRIIGDREQALQEVVDEAARQKRVNEGRWTGQKLGTWRLGVVLGRGAMGEVYEAVGPKDRPAAIKLLNARSTASTSIVERFHREMDVAARLESPHIVHVYEVSTPDAPVPYIAMELLQGVDLATKLRNENQNRMPSDELVVLIDQVARGLEVARLAGVVHRDLKPHNLFHHDGSVWKILDFGVSKVLDSEGTLTGEGIVGTPQYMAPEQASGGQVTHLADVYALGAIAYRCLTGRSPFKGKDLAELVYQVVHTPPARPSTLGRVSQSIEDVLAVAMAKDPRRRFTSAMSFAQAFIAARRGRKVAIDIPDNAWVL
ncbi:MAG TPA: serine/threonine-protein kinase [Kofleriaceae bacterium]|nr:serine/threonine-protein kinase [Kofleriaceae bacterium]